ncbi:max-binding protein MNT isoform X2 [Bufo gargarizans]|uniref:max-binding protein MNT isoform X2 n=1 Tax=Bufo gargarizans TaxID=30331 RepID=UPI001CF503FA|nr:max-binding protein MNT isoform X2 [Bufo gargarizans]
MTGWLHNEDTPLPGSSLRVFPAAGSSSQLCESLFFLLCFCYSSPSCCSPFLVWTISGGIGVTSQPCGRLVCGIGDPLGQWWRVRTLGTAPVCVTDSRRQRRLAGDMSLETLLQAALFLEWQAQQQQQSTREENDNIVLEQEEEEEEEEKEKEKQIISRKEELVNQAPPDPASPPAPAPPPPPPPPLPTPVTVIPLSVVTNTPQPVVQTSLSPPVVQRQPAFVNPPVINKDVSLAPVIQRPQGPGLPEIKSSPLSVGSPKQLHPYPTPVLAITHHHIVQQQQQQQHQQPIQPQPTALQHPQQQPPAQPLGALRLSSADDGRPNEQRRRPGGRAHLKECFETLKRNIPNVDDKKTSNLSVLRSALRYIQSLKRKEKDYEHEMERLAREKIATQQRLADLKNELSQWMDIMEIDRIVRQNVQPEDDQASTSTASEGEDNIDEDMDDDRPINALQKRQQLELLKMVPSNAASLNHHSTVLPQHVSIQQKQVPSPHAQPLSSQALIPPQAMVPAQTHIVAASTVQSTVIAHTATTHASVIQTLNHVIPGPQTKHIAHIAPSTSSPVQLTTAAQPIGHITVHPAAINHMTHLGQQLPIYPQSVAVSQPMMSHIAHTISHPQVNGTTNLGQPTVMAKPTVGTQVVHHPQLVGQTVLNPVTMVTMPSFPVSTLKLA